MIRKGGIPVEKRFKFISDIDILGMVHGILGIARDLDINVMAVEVKRYTYLKVYHPCGKSAKRTAGRSGEAFIPAGKTAGQRP